MAESDKFALDASVAQVGFSFAIRSTRARIAFEPGAGSAR